MPEASIMNSVSFAIDPSTLTQNPRCFLALVLLVTVLKNTYILSFACLYLLVAVLLGVADTYRPRALISSLDKALTSTKRALYQAMDEADGTRDFTEFTAKLRRLQCTAAGLRKRSLQASINWRTELSSLFSGLVKNILMVIEEARGLQARIEIVMAEEEQRRLADR